MTRMISYSQNFEDVIIARAFPRDYVGFYIDVGASDACYHSVTKHFYDAGWQGINIEPMQRAYESLCLHRTRDLNLNMGLASREKTLTFYEFAASIGLSTFCSSLVDEHRDKGLQPIARTVPCSTLALVCERHVRQTIDFLKIDTEGFEWEVLDGNDWQRWRPRIVLVEANTPTPQWEYLLLNAGYSFATTDCLNRYYVRNEDARLASILSRPVSPVFDDFIPHEYYERISDLSIQLASLKLQLEQSQSLLPAAGVALKSKNPLHKIYRFANRLSRKGSAEVSPN